MIFTSSNPTIDIRATAQTCSPLTNRVWPSVVFPTYCTHACAQSFNDLCLFSLMNASISGEYMVIQTATEGIHLAATCSLRWYICSCAKPAYCRFTNFYLQYREKIVLYHSRRYLQSSGRSSADIVTCLSFVNNFKSAPNLQYRIGCMELHIRLWNCALAKGLVSEIVVTPLQFANHIPGATAYNWYNYIIAMAFRMLFSLHTQRWSATPPDPV